MNGAAILTAVRQATLLDTNQVSDSNMLVWVNEGYYRIASGYSWPWLEATYNYKAPVGCPSIPLTSITSGLRRIAGVYDIANGARLRAWDASHALQSFGADIISDVASTITEPIAATDATSMTVADATIYTNLHGHTPSAAQPIYLRFTLDGEIVKVTNFSGNVATIARGQCGTTAATHLDNAAIKHVPWDTAGRPTGFFIWGDSLYLNPCPDDDYSLIVVYHKAPTAIATDTSPEFDTMFHGALVHYGEYRCWQREEDLDKARQAYSNFATTVEEMRKFYAQRIDDSPWAVGRPAEGRWTNTPFLDGL